jgi:hypothetical protein
VIDDEIIDGPEFHDCNNDEDEDDSDDAVFAVLFSDCRKTLDKQSREAISEGLDTAVDCLTMIKEKLTKERPQPRKRPSILEIFAVFCVNRRCC